jgi:site-specific DNA-adenine methylase
MQYQGGKSRIARPIAETIRRMYPTRTEIWEPFCGGGAVTLAMSKMGFKVHASDIHPDLIMMWQAVMAGDSSVYADVTEGEYNSLKSAPSSARRGFVGFGASFGGSWFGGYGRRPYMPSRNMSQESARNNLRLRGRDILFACLPYTDTPSDVLVYADIPYQGTKAYNRATFDHQAFWQWVRERNGPTFVSELTAPDDMQIVWRKAHKSQMTSNSPTSRATSGIVHREERLYYFSGCQ